MPLGRYTHTVSFKYRLEGSKIYLSVPWEKYFGRFNRKMSRTPRVLKMGHLRATECFIFYIYMDSIKTGMIIQAKEELGEK